MEHFIQCKGCQDQLSASQFLNAVQIKPLSIMFKDGDIYRYVYSFIHEIRSCGYEMDIPVSKFESFIDEPISPEILAGSKYCPMCCAETTDLENCAQECYFAPFRRLLFSMRRNYETKMQGNETDQQTDALSNKRGAIS